MMKLVESSFIVTNELRFEMRRIRFEEIVGEEDEFFSEANEDDDIDEVAIDESSWEL